LEIVDNTIDDIDVVDNGLDAISLADTQVLAATEQFQLKIAVTPSGAGTTPFAIEANATTTDLFAIDNAGIITTASVTAASIANATITGADLATDIVISTSGNISTTGTLTVGTGGTAITRHVSETFTINIANIAASACVSTAQPVASAAVADSTVTVSPNPIAGGIETGTVTWSAFVSAANEVTIRACNIATVTAFDPAATQVWRIDVWRH
jgi:hypothetical protein